MVKEETERANKAKTEFEELRKAIIKEIEKTKKDWEVVLNDRQELQEEADE